MSEEMQYLSLLRDIKENGKLKKNRTGIDTLGTVGAMMRFDLRNNIIPLLTTKRVHFKGIVHELLWFLSGKTDINYLKENNVKIWNKNAEDFYTKIKDKVEENLEAISFLEKAIINLEKEFIYHKKTENHETLMLKGEQLVRYQDEYYAKVKELDWMEEIREGDLGPVYGYQWRNFNGQQVDQISNAVDDIKNNPTSRRIIVSAWNPVQLNQMALPPCHLLFQFIVEDEDLSCVMYQRSADFFLGVPYNIASYSLLTHMVAAVTGKKAKEFIHFLGDCHIYTNHLEQVEEQISRSCYPFPKISLKPKESIFDYKYEDIELIDYKHHSFIKADMAV